MLIALTAALLAASPQPPSAQAAPAAPTAELDQRADLQRFSARLEQRLAAACRPAEPMVFMSGLPETRFVYLDGVGAVFLLPARSLPRAPAEPGQPEPEISVSATRPEGGTGPQVMVIRRPGDLTDLEARIRETRKQAERMRAQADLAFADAERQLMAELRPGADESQPTTSFPLPWTLFLEDAVDDSRPVEQVEADVKQALIMTIVEDASLLRSLLPTDMVTASVELVTRPQPWVRARPARTIVVQARKADLDAYKSGTLEREALLKKVQTKAY